MEHADGKEELEAGQAIHVEAGEEVIFSTPAACEYLSVCTPAYSKAAIHRSKNRTGVRSKREMVAARRLELRTYGL